MGIICPPLVGIGLTELPNSGGAKVPPAPTLSTALTYTYMLMFLSTCKTLGHLMILLIPLIFLIFSVFFLKSSKRQYLYYKSESPQITLRNWSSDCRHQKQGPSDRKGSISCALIHFFFQFQTLRTKSKSSWDNNLSRVSSLLANCALCK